MKYVNYYNIIRRIKIEYRLRVMCGGLAPPPPRVCERYTAAAPGGGKIFKRSNEKEKYVRSSCTFKGPREMVSWRIHQFMSLFVN